MKDVPIPVHGLPGIISRHMLELTIWTAGFVRLWERNCQKTPGALQCGIKVGVERTGCLASDRALKSRSNAFHQGTVPVGTPRYRFRRYLGANRGTHRRG
jgi:hypothetical protein